MSFDLAVWFAADATTETAAAAKYRGLVDQDPAAPRAPTHPRVAAFHRELIERFAEAEPSDEDAERQAPPAISLDVSEDAVLMSVGWPHAQRLAALVRDLAGRHGLVYFDPQGPAVHHPPNLCAAGALTLSCCDGAVHQDPSPARIDRALRRLSRHNWFAVLARVNRDDLYVQVGYGEQAGTRSGWYALERRDGGADRHFRTETSDLSEIVTAFTGFAAGADAWQRRFVWRPVELDGG